MYHFFTSLNTARQAAGNASSSFFTTQMNISALSSNELLISKPPLISILSNQGSSSSSSSFNLMIPSSSSGWAASTTVIDAISCSTFTTDGSGNLAVGIQGGMPRVMIDNSKKGSLCSNVDATTSPSGKSGKSSAGRLEVGWAATMLSLVVAVMIAL